MTTYTNLISAADLEARIDRVVLLDVRAKLGAPGWGREQFLEGHLPGAQFVDLDQDLAAPPDERGRHPLPAIDDWIASLRQLGIGNDDQVVCYDDAGGAYAARAWWMLRWVGHATVAVLDGGMGQWSGALESGPAAQRDPGTFTVGAALTRTVSAAELVAQLGEPDAPTLYDARAEARWAGREEPIDPVAGHIPGALCRAFADNLGADGCFKPAAELAARFEGPAHIVCYCGSGVTAAHNILAMHVAGLPEPELYADSWSGWITDPARPIETAE